MTQKPNRILIDTNKHGIRREINLDNLYKESQKKKARANRPYKKNKSSNE